MQRNTLAASLALLAEVFGREVSPVLTEVYWEIFRGYPDATFRKAVLLALKTLSFFPKPSDLLRILEGAPEDRALIAWQTLEKAIRTVGSWDSVRFDDPALSAAVEGLGGWTKVCEWTEEEMPFRRREFEQLYRVFADRRIPGPEWHPGWIEINNRAGGWLQYIPVPRAVSINAGEPAKGDATMNSRLEVTTGDTTDDQSR